MSAAEVGNDRDSRLHREMTEIKELLEVLIQSQAKQAESQQKLADAQVRQIESQEKIAKSQAQQAKAHAQSQAQQAKSQEKIQNQMLEVLKSIGNAGNKQQEKDLVKNNNGDSKVITKASGSGGAGEVKQPSIVGKDTVKHNIVDSKEIPNASSGGGGEEEKQPTKIGKDIIAIKNTNKDTRKSLPPYDNLPQEKEKSACSNAITKASGSSTEEKQPSKIEKDKTACSNEITKASGSITEEKQPSKIEKDNETINKAPSKEITQASTSGSVIEEKLLKEKVPLSGVQGAIQNNAVYSKETTKPSSSGSSGGGEITKASSSGGGGDITKASGSGVVEEKKPSKVEEKIVRAIYKPDRNDLLLKGDCENTIQFLKTNPAALTHGVTSASNTVLHVALYKRREMKLIREIIELSSPELLEYRAGGKDNTALHYAAQHGNLEAAKLLVNKNPGLLLILNKSGESPFELAICSISHGQKEVAEYLYSQTIDLYPIPFSGTNGAWYFCRLIEGHLYDIALHTVKKFPELATAKSAKYGMCGLEMMVRRPFAFKSGAKLTWWQNLIYSFIQVDKNTTSIQQVEPAQSTIRDVENPMPGNLDCTKVEENSKVFSSTTYKGIIMPYLTRAIGIEHLYKQKLMHQQAIALIQHLLEEVRKSTTLLSFLNNNPNIIKTAIRHGIIEFIAECLKINSNLIWERISGERMIETAITERKEMILSLLCETADKLQEKIDLVSRTDVEKNTILHYAARLAPFAQLSLVSGAALQMQREMQWFRGVESILEESDRFARNRAGDTAQFKFTEAHKDLVKEGQDWLKDTSGSCMIVGALIATVAFAAVFTAPGGNISDSDNGLIGTPIFLGKSSFIVFAVSDALALFSSITSVLMFLAIYTSRFAEGDFLKSLPQKLIFGLATLFISMVAILVAFGASLFIVVGSRFSQPQAITPIALFASFPLVLFAWLQLPLFVEMVRSTYWGSLFQEHKSIDFSPTKTGNRKKMKEN